MSTCDCKNALIAVFLQDILVYHPPSEASTSNKLTKPTPDGKVRVGEERNKGVDLPGVSPI